jgi:UDP-N-acetylmuramoyl-L-alanyl-D-glutamate--2,6-diaminopimelate ligase
MLEGLKSTAKAVVIADRAAAIRQAILESRPGDIVLVAGKGHETWQETNGQRVPFSDEAAVRAVLEEAA